MVVLICFRMVRLMLFSGHNFICTFVHVVGGFYQTYVKLKASNLHDLDALQKKLFVVYCNGCLKCYIDVDMASEKGS